MGERPRLSYAIPIARIETLTDGVFAIAMTLLVLRVGVDSGLDSGELRHALREQWPRYVSYILSFLVLGVYWMAHQGQLGYIQRADRTFAWITLVFLGFVAFVPFTAGILGEYRDEQMAIVLYGGNLIAIGILLLTLYWYATRIGDLTDEVTPMIDHLILGRLITAPVAYAIGIGFCVVSTRLSIAIFVVVPVLYAVPHAVELIWERIPIGHHHD